MLNKAAIHYNYPGKFLQKEKQVLLIKRCQTMWKGSIEVQITQNMGEKRENFKRKLKRSPEERHTQTFKIRHLCCVFT